jgi:hypothetical protein
LADLLCVLDLNFLWQFSQTSQITLLFRGALPALAAQDKEQKKSARPARNCLDISLVGLEEATPQYEQENLVVFI